MPDNFDTKVSFLLAERISGPNDPALRGRNRKLVALFEDMRLPAVAGIYNARLSFRNEADPLSRQFHARLSSEFRARLLAILERRAIARPLAPPKPKPHDGIYRFIDEDAGTVGVITKDDPLFRKLYFDGNIAEATSMPDQETMEHHDVVIRYTDGRELTFPFEEVPARRYYKPRPGQRMARIKKMNIWPDAYKKKNNIIFPVDHHGNIMYNDKFTPNLIDIFTTIHENIRRRRRLLFYVELGAVFANMVAAGGGMYNPSGVHVTGGGRSWQARPLIRRSTPKEGGPSLPKTSRNGLHVYTDKSVDVVDMIRWEKQGGHGLQHHGPHLTRRMLRERVLMTEKRRIPSPSRHDEPDYRPFRVWGATGKEIKKIQSNTATRWKDEKTMTDVIGTLISKNIVEIRNSTRSGKDVKIFVKDVGRVTGDGYVKTGSGDDGALMFKDDFRGAYIHIKPRKATDKDADTWYLHTAFPADRAP